MASIEARNLTVRFGGHVAVDDVTCAFDRGTVTAIVGPNGAGKTTFFQLLSGQCAPTSGDVLLRGKIITRLPPSARAKQGIGRGFQLTNLFPNLTVLENVVLACRARKRRGLDLRTIAVHDRDLSDLARAHLGQVLLLSRAGAKASDLSHGDQRKLDLALLLALDAEILLLDEPTAGMNLEEIPVILDIISAIRKDPRRTVLLVEHKMEVVRSLADRIIVLHNGRLVADGLPAEIEASAVVQEAYLGKRARVS